MEHYFQEVTAEYAGGAPLKSWNISKSPPVEVSDNNNSGGFDCNICLESVQDPVVTFCGHLYCWPCIYKWIHLHTISDEKPDYQEPQCPVCKAEVSEKSLIPLYGPGLMTNSSDKKASSVGIVIPQRPQNPRYTASADHIATTRTASNSQPNLSQPMAGMFGEMVYPRMFGNSQTTLYTYPNYSYHLAGRTSQRMRRRMMAVDKSLSRICFFLFCCMMSCLLLF